MLTEKKVYSVNLGNTILPGAAEIVNFQLNSYGRKFFINSIFFDISLMTTAPVNVLPLEQNTTQEFGLLIYGFPIADQIQIANPFENISVPGAIVSSGRTLRIYRPGQFHFQNWRFANNIGLTFDYQNHDLVITYMYDCSVTIEIEETK
jgi:hypothetical protein